MAVPDEPPNDPITASLLSAFRNVCRGRRYIAGMSGAFPMRLSAREISDWLEAHPLPLPRRYVDEVMFALDELALEKDED